MVLPAFSELSSTERNELVLSTLAWINGALTQLTNRQTDPDQWSELGKED
jgi:hypothetical protein